MANASPVEPVARLENGDHLTRTEFERRYEAMPEDTKAELIEGVVFLSSPVRIRISRGADRSVERFAWGFTRPIRREPRRATTAR